MHYNRRRKLRTFKDTLEKTGDSPSTARAQKSPLDNYIPTDTSIRILLPNCLLWKRELAVTPTEGDLRSV